MWGAQRWNQWALQPAMFNDVPHEQIDWAALAKQWIQMQQTQPPDSTVSPVLPPVPPPVPSTTAPSIIPPLPPGHGPVIPDEFPSEVAGSTALLKTPVVSGGMPESFQTDRPFEAQPAGFTPKSANNSYWNKSQWEASAASDIDERMWPGSSMEPAASLIAGKETYDYGHVRDNPPLAMQSIDYNHMSDFSYNQIYPENQYDQYWSQVNAAPPISPMFLKKEHTTSTSNASSNLPVDEDSSQIDAAKRKQLPAWIREGLEKMEQERLKKLQKEKVEKEKAERLAQAKLKTSLDEKNDGVMAMPAKSKFDSDSDGETEEENVNVIKPVMPKRSPSPIEDTRTEEEKRQEYMLNIRRILTEVLLTVTNAEMYSIAEEVLRKEKQKARQLASSASLTTVASGLCSLANYGTESEASEAEEEQDSDSEEELYRRIREKKKLFAIKEKKIIAEIERRELEEQNEALQAKNEDLKSADYGPEEQEVIINTSEKPVFCEEAKQVTFIPPSDASGACIIPFLDNIASDPAEPTNNNTSNKELKTSNNKDSHSSASSSSSSSSDTESESGDKHKKNSDKNEHESRSSDRSKEYKKDKIPKKHRRHRSSESDSSERHRKSSKAHDKGSKKSSSYKKKKKYKRSDSSSSSSSGSRKRKYSSKSEPGHNHRERRSHSYDDRDRKRRRGESPKHYRSTRDSHRSKDSYSYRHEKDKYLKRDRDDKHYYDSKRSPSPYRRSSKLPKKYRSSRSPSSESENSYRKTKKYRAR